jgi:ribosomal protein S12 methylthiotransferase
MLDTPTVVPYFDLSLQHADRALLARMARWGSGDRFLTMIDRIRAANPDATFRSSFIVGFPGETEAAHDTLLAFLDDAQLDWAGFFAFSPEDGTPAATMDGVVPRPVIDEWLAECDQTQAPITAASRDRLVGAELDVLVDGADDERDGIVGRTHREAPEIDGVIRLAATARPGVLIRAKGTEAIGPDLLAEPIEILG